MEEDREQRHSCRFCRKSFPCGRSLGGHMRSHMTMISAETDEHLPKKKAPVDSGAHSSSMGHEGGTHVSYGLRENPKKTWRMSDSISNGFRRGKVCKECGKEFTSWNTLFGHMRCHPTDGLHHRSVMDAEDSSSSGGVARKIVSDSQSDNEGRPLPRRRQSRRRTRRSRYGAVSSSISEVEQQEEDVAICLMMLSRDVWSWGGLNSAAQSSDNITVDLDIRSSRVGKGITGKNEDFVCNEDEAEKMNEPKEEKGEFDAVSDMESAQVQRKRSQSFRSEFLLNRAKKAESDDSNDGLSKYKQELSDAELVGNEARFDVELENEDHRRKDGHKYSEFELRRNVCKKSQLNGEVTKFGNGWSKENSSGQPGLNFRRYNSNKKARSDAYEDEMGQDSHKRMRSDAVDDEPRKNRQKKGSFECTTCNKIFHSYQALGGHRASHKRIKGCFASKIESSEYSIETDVSPDQMANGNIKSCKIENLIDGMRGGDGETSYAAKKIKGHECPICLKVFSSGQALGGHKRSHMIGNSEARSDASQTIVIEQNLPEVPDMPDLNLPASIDDDSNAQVGFNPWWTGGNHKHEPLVAVISN